MKILGVIAIILGILCLLAPGLTGTSVLIFLGVFVLAAGIVMGIKLFFVGLIMVMGGSAVRSMAQK